MLGIIGKKAAALSSFLINVGRRNGFEYKPSCKTLSDSNYDGGHNELQMSDRPIAYHIYPGSSIYFGAASDALKSYLPDKICPLVSHTLR